MFMTSKNKNKLIVFSINNLLVRRVELFLQSLLMSGLRGKSCVLCLLLHVVCCDITHHVAPGKLHIVLGENQSEQDNVFIVF